MPAGYTGAILSERRFTTKLPWLVRESVPITTPPSNVVASIVVAFATLASIKRKDAAAVIEAAKLPNTGCMRNASSSASQPQPQQW